MCGLVSNPDKSCGAKLVPHNAISSCVDAADVNLCQWAIREVIFCTHIEWFSTEAWMTPSRVKNSVKMAIILVLTDFSYMFINTNISRPYSSSIKDIFKLNTFPCNKMFHINDSRWTFTKKTLTQQLKATHP